MDVIRAAAAELPQVNLGDALAVCMAMSQAEPGRFERAAVRWLARFCMERPAATIEDVRVAALAFEEMRHTPERALVALQALCR